MAGVAQCPDVPVQIRIHCCAEVAQYMYPKIRPIGAKSDTGQNREPDIMEAYRERVLRKNKIISGEY